MQRFRSFLWRELIEQRHQPFEHQVFSDDASRSLIFTWRRQRPQQDFTRHPEECAAKIRCDFGRWADTPRALRIRAATAIKAYENMWRKKIRRQKRDSVGVRLHVARRPCQ